MRNKKLIALAATLALTVQTGFATDISGVTGTNGVYNINPEAVKGTTGFRHYENFYLSQQDIANLIMKYGTKDLGTFINMVDNKVNIQGILNTMRNGEFTPGHAVFISPKGMVVGASGVLNVGSLSVLTPTETKYNTLKNDISKIDLSALKEDANGDILIRGKVFARGNVNLQGANVAIPESAVIMNGAASDVALKSQEDANTLLFNSLVKTDKLMAGTELANKDGKIVIRAAGKDGMLNVRGDIYNNNKGNITLTNEKGANGLKVTSTIKNVNGEVILNNNAGKTLLKGDIVNNGGFILLTDNGKGIHLNSGSNLTAQTGGLKIENNGSEGLAMYGDVTGLDGDVSIQNNKGKLYIAGNVDYKGTGEFQIINNAEKDSQLMVAKSASVNSSKDIYMKNKGDNGLYINSEMKAGKNLTLDNQAGDLTINNKITSGTGSSLMNSGNKLAISSKGFIINGDGNLVVKNTGNKGSVIYGTLENNGEAISLTNDAGNLIVNGKVNAKSGNIGIINNGLALNIKENGSVNNVKGKTNIVNYGEDGLAMNGKVSSTGNDLLLENNDGNLYIAGDVDYKGTGEFQIINNAEDNSQLMIAKSAQIKSASDVYAKNKSQGGLFVNGTIDAANSLTLDNQAGDLTLNNNVSVANGNLNLMNSGDKLAISSKSTVSAKGGNLVVKNTGDKGTVIYGTLENEGDTISVTNNAGNLIVNGKVNAKSGNIGIINRGDQLYLKDKSVVNNAQGKTNIINSGVNGMKAIGRIDVNDEVNIYNEDGQAYIDGYVISNGGDINILSRYNSDGVYVRQNAHITNLPRIESDKVGTVTIKDTAVAGGSGVIIKGTVDSMNDIVVRSTDNNVYTNGKINATNAVNYSITANNGQMTFGKETEIKAATESYKLKNGSILKDLRARGSQINPDNIHYIVDAEEEI